MDASCAPGNANAAKGLVNHITSTSTSQFQGGSSSASANVNAQRLGRQAPQAPGAQSFFSSNPPSAIRPPIQMQMGPSGNLMHQQHAHQMPTSGWSHEFGEFEGGLMDEVFANAMQQQPHLSTTQMRQIPMNTTPMSMMSMRQPMQMQGWNNNLLANQNQSVIHQPVNQISYNTHDPALTEQEWHQQFDQFESEFSKSKGKEPAGVSSSSIPSTHVHGDLDSWAQEFDKLDLKEDKEGFLANWEQEFGNIDFDAASTEEERQELMKKMGDVWAELKKAEKEDAAKNGASEWTGGYEDFMNQYGGGGSDGGQVVDPDPVTAPWTGYNFEPENPYMGHRDAMAQGLRILASPGGSLSQAALAFEAAVQMGDSENSDAWMHLGKIQAENEKEGAAIAALQRSVQLNPSNLESLMAISVCYTNEGQELQAYATLNRWLTTKYPQIPETTPNSDPNSFTSTYEIHESSTARFIQAVQSSGGTVDADLQLGLGILFYNRSEYDKVIDCFSAALRERSGDYLLWNRLGATLANSGRSEEAIEAYHKALELKPSFVRCRYNLGVSCINIGAYREAAEHLLGALSLHVVGDEKALGYVNVSENLWDTLRRTFVQMNRMDLAEMTNTDRDVNKYRKDFEF